MVPLETLWVLIQIKIELNSARIWSKKIQDFLQQFKISRAICGLIPSDAKSVSYEKDAFSILISFKIKFTLQHIILNILVNVNMQFFATM